MLVVQKLTFTLFRKQLNKLYQNTIQLIILQNYLLKRRNLQDKRLNNLLVYFQKLLEINLKRNEQINNLKLRF